MALLIALVERAGHDVNRDDLTASVWPDHTHVDFDDGIATAIRKVRQALGDSAESPTYIRTLHRRGYRFIAPVYPIEAATQPATPEPPAAQANGRPIAPAARPPRPRIWLLAGALALAMAGGAVWLGTRPKPPVADRVRPFAAYKGQPTHPAFSPNGEILAFDWSEAPDRRAAIYVQRLEATSPVQLSKGSVTEILPRWSPDSAHVAFLRDSGDRWSIVTVLLAGREERKWTDFRKGATPWLDWSPDGKWFLFAEPAESGHPPAVVLFSLATGEKRVVTHPPTGWRGDSEAVFSPDSSLVAFRRTKAPSGDEDIYQIPVTGGEPERMTSDEIGISGLTYTPDGGLLFSSQRASSIHRLWWKPPRSNRLARVTSEAIDAVAPAMSHDGKHLAYTQLLFDVNIWSVAESGLGVAASLIDSPFPDTSPRYSPDGRRIAYHSVRSGTHEIWVCDANGANAVQLTDGRGFNMGNPRWSPDGSRIAFEWWPTGNPAIYVAPSGGGKSRPLIPDGFQDSAPAWSHDGRYVYYASTRGGFQQIWKVPVEGGAPEQVSPFRGFAPEESPDGKFLYFLHNEEIWRLPLHGGTVDGPPQTVVSSLMRGDWGNWTATNDGVYYIQRQKGVWGTIVYQDASGGAPRAIYSLTNPPLFGAGLAVSPDGKTILFAQVDRDDSSIFVQ